MCANGDVVVAEYGWNCITIFKKKGGRIRLIERTPMGQFNGPFRVAISHDGHILATDNHRLQKLTINGACVNSIGSSETGGGQLN